MEKIKKDYNVRIILILIVIAIFLSNDMAYSYLVPKSFLRVPTGKREIYERMIGTLKEDLYRDYSELAKDMIIAIAIGNKEGTETDDVMRKRILYDIEKNESSTSRQFYIGLLRMFYRLGRSFGELRDDPNYMILVCSPEKFDKMNNKKELADRYNSLLKRYREMIKWALTNRLALEGKESLVLYRGCETEDGLDRSIGPNRSNVFATESKKLASRFAAVRMLVYYNVPVDTIKGYWELYPDDIGYPRTQFEYNFDSSGVAPDSIVQLHLLQDYLLLDSSWEMPLSDALRNRTNI